jgi:DNA-binding protein H-NS
MRSSQLARKSTDELWDLREQIVEILSVKILDEKVRLEKRLGELRPQTAASSNAHERRPYPPVRPKFRNPRRPSETWAGRGKKPRWLSELLKDGRPLDDFRISA